ncbi:hypothetical protein HHA04nite_01530 [Halomonas halophila]|uniref:Uncharacterized protein n=1 Tax=Halomonas halophila TaxID=29573 RepID=A0ABQ0TZC8_9GAMM|nr:hypothetical protein HHA04nite_01530 [Halomonas halophila]
MDCARYGSGGGGSYNGGSDQINEPGVNEGHGQVLIYNQSGFTAQGE